MKKAHIVIGLMALLLIVNHPVHAEEPLLDNELDFKTNRLEQEEKRQAETSVDTTLFNADQLTQQQEAKHKQKENQQNELNQLFINEITSVKEFDTTPLFLTTDAEAFQGNRQITQAKSLSAIQPTLGGVGALLLLSTLVVSYRMFKRGGE